MNFKTIAIIYSLNKPAPVTIVEMVGNNKYLAEYKGRLCAAMFNPFSGMYYVDDVKGKLPVHTGNMNDIQYELNYLHNASQRELNAYRNIGSLKHLKRLRKEEIRREKMWKLFKAILKTVLAVFGAGCLLWVIVTGVMSLLA